MSGSAAARSGIQAEDVITAWMPLDADGGRPSSPLPLRSPFDLVAVKLERIPSRGVALVGLRDGRSIEWRVSTGVLGLTVRPTMIPAVLESYYRAETLKKSGDARQAAGILKTAAQVSRDARGATAAVWLLLTGADTLGGVRAFDEADALFGEAEQVAELLGEPTVRAEAHRQHGHMHRTSNQWKRASAEYAKALEIDASVAPDGLAVATDRHLLGVIAYLRDDLDEAERQYRQALALREALAPASAEVAESLNAMAGIRTARSDLKDSQRLLARSVEIWKRLAPGTLYLADAVHNLGVVAQELGELDRAEDQYRQALAIRESTKPGGLEVATSLNSLGLLQKDRGDLDQAEQYHRRALAIIERIAPGTWMVAQNSTISGS